MNKSKCNDKKVNVQVQKLQKKIDQFTQKLSQPIEETAASYGALIRKRVVKSAKDLLLALFIYAIFQMSQRMLAACTSIIGLAEMSDQAWQKKL